MLEELFFHRWHVCLKPFYMHGTMCDDDDSEERCMDVRIEGFEGISWMETRRKVALLELRRARTDVDEAL